METSAKSQPMHVGRKISRMRELLGVKQETLAAQLGITQQAVSKIEQSEKVDEERLEEVARALGVNKDAIVNLNEDAIINNINNTFHDNSIQNQINKTEQITLLYERLLNEKDQRIAMLEKLLENKK